MIKEARRSRRAPIRDEAIHFVGHAQKRATAANRTTMGMRLAMSACESVRMAETEQGIKDWQASHLAASQRAHGGARGVVPASRRIGPHRHFGLLFSESVKKQQIWLPKRVRSCEQTCSH